MNPQEISFDRYNSVQKEIGKYNEIQSDLKEAYELIKSVKEERDKSKNNPSRYLELDNMLKSFIIEYHDLEKSIKKAIEVDNKISEIERARIMFELSDIVNLAEKHNINEHKNIWSKLGDLKRSIGGDTDIDTEKAKENAINLRDKNINAYTKDETIAALEYLNNNYKKGPWAKESSIGNRLAINYHSINQLDDFGEVNMFQELLIEKILGKGRGFNNEYILGFSNDKGNYIEKISDFEKGLSKKNINDLNSRTLSNYFLYLKSIGKLTPDYIKTVISTNLLKEIDKTWSGNKENNYARDILEQSGILTEIKEVLKITKIEADKIRESISPIYEKLEEINKKGEFEFYLENPGYITYIEDENIINSIINVFKNNNENLHLKYINQKINHKFIENKSVMIDFFDIWYISDTSLNNFENLNKLVKNNLSYSNYILLKAIGINTKPEIIKEVIIQNNIKIKEENSYINIYIGEKDYKINKENFDKIRLESNNFSNIKNLKNEEKTLITKYLIQNLDKKENISIISNLIGKGFIGKEGEFLNLPIQDPKISISILKYDINLLIMLPKNHLGDKDVIDAFLNGGKRNEDGKLTEDSREDKKRLFHYLDLSNINRMLQVFSFLIKIEEKNKKDTIITSILLDNPYILGIITNNLSNNLNIGIEDKYKDELLIFKEYIGKANLIIYEHDFINGKRNFDNKISKIDKNKAITKLSSNIETKLNGTLEKRHIDGILNILKTGKNNEEILIKLTNYLIRNKLDKEIFNIIIGELNNFKEEEIKELGESINHNQMTRKFFKEVDGNNKFDEKILISEFNNFLEENKKELENLSGEEKRQKIEELKNKFIKSIFKNSSEKDEKDKIAIKKILDERLEIESNKVKVENREAYFEYVKSGKTDELSFEDYAKENKIQLNQPSNQENIVQNNSYKIETNSYSYNTSSGNLEINSKSGIKKLELSNEEQKIVQNNPETLKKIVDFYSILERVGLSKLWTIKEKIFNIIGSVKGIGFKIDQNYLSENETKIFLNAVLKSTGEDTINSILGINDFIAKIERKNNTQFSGTEAQVNKSGDTKIEQKFISSFAPRGNLLGFNSPAFEEKLRS